MMENMERQCWERGKSPLFRFYLTANSIPNLLDSFSALSIRSLTFLSALLISSDSYSKRYLPAEIYLMFIPLNISRIFFIKDTPLGFIVVIFISFFKTVFFFF